MQEIFVTQYMGNDLFKKYIHQFCGFIPTVRLFGENLCHIQQKSPDDIPKSIATTILPKIISLILHTVYEISSDYL